MFIVSGATGLIDQFCFSKYLSYIVGATAHAVSAVLAAFMCGLALGAHFAGKKAAQVRRPLVAYGVLEVLVGVFVALGPLAFRYLTPLYVWLAGHTGGSVVTLSAVRWLLAMLIVVAPTAMMGATLPLLSRLLGGGDSSLKARLRTERRLGALYAINTLGGALGALGAAYLILPAIGLAGALYAAAAGSAAVGVVAIAVGMKQPPLPTDENADAQAPTDQDAPAEERASAVGLSRNATIVLTCLAFMSGWLVFQCEVVFTHLLALVIGNSAYAFGLILAVFLVCLFAGATWAPRLHRRMGQRALPWALSLAAIGMLATLPAWDQLPRVFMNAGGIFETFAEREFVRAAAAFAVLVVPTTLMGLTFPLLLQRIASQPDLSRLVGRLTAINTLGAVVGALATGYLVLPALGSQGALTFVGCVFAVLAVSVVYVDRNSDRGGRIGPLVLAGLAVVAAFAVPKWDLARLTAGKNVYFDRYDAPEDVLFVREDVHGGVTTVTLEKGNVATLYTNGKFQGNNGHEMSAQRFFAHYPSMFVHNFDSALVIGCGTATTLGTYTAYPWKRISLIEISPAIVEAARTYFTGPNRRALEDPRVNVKIADGRNHLLVSQERYNLIGMELSSIWFAGASALYAKEYYELVSRHLAKGGVFQQWVQLHHTYERDFATVLNTLRQVFPHVILFYGGGQGILVAGNEPLKTSSAHLTKLEGIADVKSLLPGDRSLPSLFADVLVLNDGLDAFLKSVAADSGLALSDMVSTDDNMYLEYATPRGNVLPWHTREDLVRKLWKFRVQSDIDALIER